MRSLANTTIADGTTVNEPSVYNINHRRELRQRALQFCYSGLLAGGGIRGGMTYVTSDAHGVYPDSDPVTPLDFGTSTIDALGIPIGSVVPDREGRPHAITCGKTIDALFV